MRWGRACRSRAYYLTIPAGGGDLVIPGHAEAEIPPQVRMGVARGPEQFRQKAEQAVAGGADLLKIIASGAVLAFGGVPGEREMLPEEIKAVVDVAHAHGMKVAAHAHGAQSIKDAILAGADTIEHASLIDDEGIRLAKEHGTALSMDVYNGDWIDTVGRAEKWPEEFLRKNVETTEAQRQGFTRAHAAGVDIVYGTDAAVYPHGLNARQFPIMVQRGMTPMEAIQSATSLAARHMGWADRIGSLQPGRFGDLIAVKGDPLADVTRLQDCGRRDQGRARLQTAGGVKRWRSGLARTTCSRLPKPAACVRLAPNLQRLVAPNPSPLTGPGTNTYVVGFGPSYLVVDPGPDDTTHVDRILAATNGRISHVLCTHSHPDHSPGAAALKARTQAVVLGRPAPRDEHQDDSYRPDRTLDDGDVIEVSGAEVRALHTPGHASNHVCLLLEPEGWLLTGDHLMGGSTVVILPPDGSMRLYLESLRRLRTLPLTALLPGHGAVMPDPLGRDRSGDRTSAAAREQSGGWPAANWVAPPRSANWYRSCTPTRRSRCIRWRGIRCSPTCRSCSRNGASRRMANAGHGSRREPGRAGRTQARAHRSPQRECPARQALGLARCFARYSCRRALVAARPEWRRQDRAAQAAAWRRLADAHGTRNPSLSPARWRSARATAVCG